MAGIMRDEARNDPKRGFVGGYELETLSLGLPFMAAFLNPGAWGRSFTSAIDDYPNMAGLWIVGEDMPQETNRVTLDPKVKDQNGMPVPASISTIIRTTKRCATTRTGRAPPSMRRWVQCARSPRRPIRARTIWAPTA